MPLQPGKGYSITSVGTGTAPRHPMKLVEANIACSLFDKSPRVSGMFERGAHDDGVSPRLIRHTLSGASRYLGDWQLGPAGLQLTRMRPSTRDGLPLIGVMPGREGVYVVTGHGRLDRGHSRSSASGDRGTACRARGSPNSARRPAKRRQRSQPGWADPTE